MPIPLVAGAAILSATIVPLAVKLIAGLGFGFVVFQGLNLLLSETRLYVMEQFQNLPPEAWAMMAIARVDVAMSMIFSAYTVRLVLMGVNGAGGMTRFVSKGFTGA